MINHVFIPFTAVHVHLQKHKLPIMTSIPNIFPLKIASICVIPKIASFIEEMEGAEIPLIQCTHKRIKGEGF